MITIKKYPNRRLYDTARSQYINLDAIRDLVLRHKDFKVVDSKSNKDLTKSILLQIISDQEGIDQQTLLSQPVLMQLIRTYGSGLREKLRHFLEQSVAGFLQQHPVVDSDLSASAQSASVVSCTTASADFGNFEQELDGPADSAGVPSGRKSDL